MKLLLLALSLFLSLPALAFDQSHPSWAKILKNVVVAKGAKSEVNYDWLKANPSHLRDYIHELEAVPLGDYQAWNKNQQIAFLINAYNAYTLKLILIKYPNLKSIKDLGGFLYSPWKKEFFTVLGSIQSLDQIEHQWLRRNFKEPRIHFAIVCASIGCPALSEVPFVGDTLPEQLEQAKVRFLQDTTRNRYDAKSSTLYLAKIFDWFEEDFEAVAGSVEAFVATSVTSNPADQAKIKNKQVDIEYTDYDWSLNKLK